MIDTDTPFGNALISSLEIERPRNMKNQVEDRVINRCLERGLLCEEDKRNKSKKYQWVCNVIENDLPALLLLRKEKTKITTSSDLRDFFYDVDDMCEDVVMRIAKRILDWKV